METGTGMSATSFGPMSHSKDIGYILSRGEGDATFGSSRGSAVWLEERETREPSSFARFSSLRRKKAPPLSVPSDDEFVRPMAARRLPRDPGGVDLLAASSKYFQATIGTDGNFPIREIDPFLKLRKRASKWRRSATRD